MFAVYINVWFTLNLLTRGGLELRSVYFVVVVMDNLDATSDESFYIIYIILSVLIKFGKLSLDRFILL